VFIELREILVRRYGEDDKRKLSGQ